MIKLKQGWMEKVVESPSWRAVAQNPSDAKTIFKSRDWNAVVSQALLLIKPALQRLIEDYQGIETYINIFTRNPHDNPARFRNYLANVISNTELRLNPSKLGSVHPKSKLFAVLADELEELKNTKEILDKIVERNILMSKKKTGRLRTSLFNNEEKKLKKLTKQCNGWSRPINQLRKTNRNVLDYLEYLKDNLKKLIEDDLNRRRTIAKTGQEKVSEKMYKPVF